MSGYSTGGPRTRELQKTYIFQYFMDDFGFYYVLLVAGAGFEPTTFRL
jgi:hypothetical protein